MSSIAICQLSLSATLVSAALLSRVHACLHVNEEWPVAVTTTEP